MSSENSIDRSSVEEQSKPGELKVASRKPVIVIKNSPTYKKKKVTTKTTKID